MRKLVTSEEDILVSVKLPANTSIYKNRVKHFQERKKIVDEIDFKPVHAKNVSDSVVFPLYCEGSCIYDFRVSFVWNPANHSRMNTHKERVFERGERIRYTSLCLQGQRIARNDQGRSWWCLVSSSPSVDLRAWASPKGKPEGNGNVNGPGRA